VLDAYRKTPLGSPIFNTRLIELIAIAVHQIAGWMYEQGPLLSEDDELMSWRPKLAMDTERLREIYPKGLPATFFQHSWYHDDNMCIADQVGYWAENRILGGVVLFDRRDLKLCSRADVGLGVCIARRVP
jgi:hypothetical protein